MFFWMINFFVGSQIHLLNIDEQALISYGVSLSFIKDGCWCFIFCIVFQENKYALLSISITIYYRNDLSKL